MDRAKQPRKTADTICHFLRLPLESRLQIYGYLLLDPPDAILQPRKPIKENPKQQEQDPKRLMIELESVEQLSNGQSRETLEAETAQKTADPSPINLELRALDLFTIPFQNVCNKVYGLVDKIMEGALNPEQGDRIIPQVVQGLATLQSAITALSAAYVTHTDKIFPGQTFLSALGGGARSDGQAGSSLVKGSSLHWDMDNESENEIDTSDPAYIDYCDTNSTYYCTCTRVLRYPAILQTNRQIHLEATQLLYSTLRITVNPGLAICRCMNRLLDKGNWIQCWNNDGKEGWYHTGPSTMGLDMNGSILPLVFARFQKVRLCAEFNLKIDSPLIQLFVDKLSNSPLIRHLELSVGLELRAKLAGNDDYLPIQSSNPTRDLLLRKDALASTPGTELFIESEIFQPLRQLTNVQCLTIILNDPPQSGDEPINLSPDCVAAILNLKETVEANFVAKPPWQPMLQGTDALR